MLRHDWRPPNSQGTRDRGRIFGKEEADLRRAASGADKDFKDAGARS